MGQSGASAGLQARRSGGVQNCPVARPDTALRRVMGLLLRGAGRQKSEALLSAPLGPAPSARRAMLPNRGVRERPCADAGCHAAPGGKEPFCCEYSEYRCIKTGIGLNACAGSEVALGESRLRGSQASLNSNCRKTGESTFHLERRCRLHAGSSSTLSNSTNGWRAWQWRSYERRCPILELAHPPPCDNGANSLEIHDPRLLKSSASRQEKASACNRNCAATDEHFLHDVILDRRADVNAAGT